jgi:prenyltransferase beta subunit
MSIYHGGPRGDIQQVSTTTGGMFDSILIAFRHMDIPMLVSWLSARQSAPEGGLSGRTNKLVDGCYSHWVGGCWPLLESALNGKPGNTETPVGSLFSREGLTRYILGCCQGHTGGLRDKPGKYGPLLHRRIPVDVADRTPDTSIHTIPATFWQA